MQRYLAILLLLVGCTPRTTPSSNAPQSVKTAVVETESYEIREFAALSTADDAVNLAFKISGRIVDLPVAKGQRVRRGEVLAVLDKRDVELQTEAARATFAEAQSRLRRAATTRAQRHFEAGGGVARKRCDSSTFGVRELS